MGRSSTNSNKANNAGSRNSVAAASLAENNVDHLAFLQRSLDRNDTDLAAVIELNRSLHLIKEQIILHCSELTLLDLGEGILRLSPDGRETLVKFRKPASETVKITTDPSDMNLPEETKTDNAVCEESLFEPYTFDQRFKEDLCIDFLLRMKLRRRLLSRLIRRLMRVATAMDGNDVSPPIPPRYGDLRLDVDDAQVEIFAEHVKRQDAILKQMQLRLESVYATKSDGKQDEIDNSKSSTLQSREMDDTESKVTIQDESKEIDAIGSKDISHDGQENVGMESKSTIQVVAPEEIEKIESNRIKQVVSEEIDGIESTNDNHDTPKEIDGIESNDATKEKDSVESEKISHDAPSNLLTTCNEQTQKDSTGKDQSAGDSVLAIGRAEVDTDMAAVDEVPPTDQLSAKDKETGFTDSSEPKNNKQLLAERISEYYNKRRKVLVEDDYEVLRDYKDMYEKVLDPKTGKAMAYKVLLTQNSGRMDSPGGKNANGIGPATFKMNAKERDLEWKRYKDALLTRIPKQPTYAELGLEYFCFNAKERREKILKELENQQEQKDTNLPEVQKTDDDFIESESKDIRGIGKVLRRKKVNVEMISEEVSEKKSDSSEPESETNMTLTEQTETDDLTKDSDGKEVRGGKVLRKKKVNVEMITEEEREEKSDSKEQYEMNNDINADGKEIRGVGKVLRRKKGNIEMVPEEESEKKSVHENQESVENHDEPSIDEKITTSTSATSPQDNKNVDSPTKTVNLDNKKTPERNQTEQEQMQVDIKPISLVAIPSFYEQDLQRIRLVHADLMTKSIQSRANRQLDEATQSYNTALKVSNDIYTRRATVQNHYNNILSEQRIKQNLVEEYAMKLTLEKNRWHQKRMLFEHSKLNSVLPSRNGGYLTGSSYIQHFMTRSDHTGISHHVGSCLADIVDAVDNAARGLIVLEKFPERFVPPPDPIQIDMINGESDFQRLKRIESKMRVDLEDLNQRLQSSEEVRNNAWKRLLKTKCEFNVQHDVHNGLYQYPKLVTLDAQWINSLAMPPLQQSSTQKLTPQTIGITTSSINSPIGSYKPAARRVAHPHPRPPAPPQTSVDGVPAGSGRQPSIVPTIDDAASMTPSATGSGSGTAAGTASESKYSAARVKERIAADGSVAPVSEPKMTKDGLFQRPAGRQRKGMDWDAVRGIWIKQADYKDD